MEHAEDRGVGSKPQSQRQHGDGRKRGPAYEGAKHIPEALHALGKPSSILYDGVLADKGETRRAEVDGGRVWNR